MCSLWHSRRWWRHVLLDVIVPVTHNVCCDECVLLNFVLELALVIAGLTLQALQYPTAEPQHWVSIDLQLRFLVVHASLSEFFRPSNWRDYFDHCSLSAVLACHGRTELGFFGVLSPCLFDASNVPVFLEDHNVMMPFELK